MTYWYVIHFDNKLLGYGLTIIDKSSFGYRRIRPQTIKLS